MWKSLATALAALGFVWLLEVTIFDAHGGAAALSFFDQEADEKAVPRPGARLTFEATAYCKGAITSSGVQAQVGVTAADPALLPAGSVVELDFKGSTYDGTYTVLDTGPEVRGREIDIYIWSCNEALQFGRQPVRMTVVRLGWNPHATTPGFVDRLLRRSAVEQPVAPRPTAPPVPSRTPVDLPASTELPTVGTAGADALPTGD